jgi:hypothetical protein
MGFASLFLFFGHLFALDWHILMDLFESKLAIIKQTFASISDSEVKEMMGFASLFFFVMFICIGSACFDGRI